MRTKTLLLTAALCAAGIATSKAQAVYSVNAVGYVNSALGKGFNLVSNPLDNKATDGNKIKNLFASLPAGGQVFYFDGTKYSIAAVDEFTGAITGDAAETVLAPGNGVFVRVDAPTTVTFVGEVPAGTLHNQITKGFSIKASQVPQAGKVSTDLGFPKAAGDQIFVFDTAGNKYNTSNVDEFTGDWDAEPVLQVGQAVFVRTDTAKNWTRSFDISK
jgi:hypothetical protein